MWIFYPLGSAYSQLDHVLFESTADFERLTGYQLKRSPTLDESQPVNHLVVFDGATRIGDAYKKKPVC